MLGHISAPHYLPQAMAEVERIYNNQRELAFQFMAPTQVGMDVEGAAGAPEVVPSPHTDLTPWLDLHYKSVLNELPILLGRVIAIQRTRASGQVQKAKAKKALKEKVDTEMADAIPNKKSLQQLIRAELQKSKPAPGPKKPGKDNQKSKKKDSGKKVKRFHPYRTPELTDLLERKGQRSCSKTASRLGLCQEEAEELEQERQRQGCLAPLEVLAESWQSDISAGKIRYEHPLSWPDWVIDELPIDWAVVIIARCIVPAAVLEANRIKHFVHIGPGIELDSENVLLFRQLSMGLKTLLPKKCDPKVIKKTWVDFVERIRWRTYFAKKLLTDDDFESESYDHDYKVPHLRKKAPKGDFILEAAIEAGETYVNDVTAKIPPYENRNPSIPFLGKLRKYLEDKDYVVLPTDKNLGCSVVTMEWFITNTQNLLDDVSNYVPLSEHQKLAYIEKKIKEVESLASQVVDNKQLSRFLTQFVPEPEDGQRNYHYDQLRRVNIPKFYGIPKIHKNPVKCRPIAPCHSALQNPAAKLLSKLLKPIIGECRYIISGTKQLTDALRNVKLQEGRPWTLITGDVVAFYPNIPLDDAEAFTIITWKKWLRKQPQETQDRLPTTEQFRDIFRTAMTDLLVSGQDGQVYLQIKGLAMGVASSPDVANLYGFYHEEFQLRPIEHNLAFYGRYIDDIFAIVYQDHPSGQRLHAKALMEHHVHYTGCTIEWGEQTNSLAFLDLWIYKDGDHSLQWKPYRKPFNHLERIPWDSAHPLDIKRGTFIGELSRLATLSSKLEHYLDAVGSLADLYLQRGYPLGVLRSWMRKYVQHRWESKDTPRPELKEHVLVLKTEFNDAWDYFDVNQLCDTMMQPIRTTLSEWRRGTLPTPAPPHQASAFIADGDLSDRNVQRFLEEFSGNSWTDLDESLAVPLDPGKAPLLAREWRIREGRGITSGRFNLINYENWIIGDRRWLLSRKRTDNVGDLATQWRRSRLQTQQFADPYPDPMVDPEHRVVPVAWRGNEIPYEELPHVGPTFPGDPFAVFFRSPPPPTLRERTSVSRTQTTLDKWLGK